MNLAQIQSEALKLAEDSGLTGPVGDVAIEAIRLGTKLAKEEGFDDIGAAVMGSGYAGEALAAASSLVGLALGASAVPVVGMFASMAGLLAGSNWATSNDQIPQLLPNYCAQLAPEPRPTGPGETFVPADYFYVFSGIDSPKRRPSVFACAAYSIYETTLDDGRAYVGPKARKAVRAVRQAIMASYLIKHGSDGGAALWPVLCDMMAAIETEDRRKAGEAVRLQLYRAAGAYTQGTQDTAFEWYWGGFQTYPHLYYLLTYGDNPVRAANDIIKSQGWLTMGSILCRATSLDPLYAIDELVLQWRLDTDPFYQPGRALAFRNAVRRELGQPVKAAFTREQKVKLKKQLENARKR